MSFLKKTQVGCGGSLPRQIYIFAKKYKLGSRLTNAAFCKNDWYFV